MVNIEIRLIIFSATKDGEALCSQEKQDQELTVAQIMKTLLQNSDLKYRKWVSLVAQLVKNPRAMQAQFSSWVRKIPWRRDRLPTPVFLGFPGGSDGKEFTCNRGNLGSIPVLGRSPGEGNGHPLQYSCLENFQGQRSLEGYSSWGRKELDMTE